MTKRQITLKALSHEKTEKLPYYLSLLEPAKERLVKFYGTRHIHGAMGSYILELSANPDSLKVFKDDVWVDTFGVVWRDTGVNRGYLLHSPLEEPSLKGYRFPDPRDPRKYEGIAEKIERSRDLFAVCWMGDLFERAHFLRGFESLLMDFVEHPQFAHELFDRILDYNLAVIDELGKFDLDAIFVSDDYGHQRGLLMSRTMWEDFIGSRLSCIYKTIKENDFLGFHHSDGDVTTLIPNFVEMGVDLLHPIQPECMNIFELKEQYGGRLSFWGGISTQRTMPYGTPEDVKSEVRSVASIMSQNGGYILGTGINLQEDVPLENMLAFVEVAKELG